MIILSFSYYKYYIILFLKNQQRSVTPQQKYNNIEKRNQKVEKEGERTERAEA